jgi:ABC-type lipoprotein release transport system permease subunit
MRRGAVVAIAGIASGAAIGLVLTRLLASMLNDVRPTDPSVFVSNAVMLLVVSLGACVIPARAAGRVDPARVLRNE